MEYQLGQKVRVKSYDEIRQTLDEDNEVIGDHIRFDVDMKRYCGEYFDVVSTFTNPFGNPRIRLKDNDWTWHPIWLVPQILDNRRIEDV
jgi:hypothetical protein